MKENDIILFYAEKRVTYKLISQILRTNFDIQLSPNAIKKRLHNMGFSRRKLASDLTRDTIKAAIEDELKSKSATVGYRTMTDILRFKGLAANRDEVMELMRQIDPSGVEFRRRRRLVRKIYRSEGPNHTWHIDGYDKLKPFGFAIHGCIDGYSRKLMWLSVGPSNNDPYVVADYYTRCVKDMGGCPMVLQADPGTENTIIGPLQLMFINSPANDSFRVVKSVFNQRIEAWWSMLRRRYTNWWIDFFHDLANFGQFNRGNNIDMEMDEVVQVWNNHYIARSRQAVVPNGRPVVLYDIPQATGGIDCLISVPADDIEWAMSQCTHSSVSGLFDFDEQAESIRTHSSFKPADSWENCLENYFTLRDILCTNMTE